MLDYLSKPNDIAKIPKSGEGRQRERGRGRFGLRIVQSDSVQKGLNLPSLALKIKGGVASQRMKVASRNWKKQGRDFPLKASREKTQW